jgi:hypothetical protein
MTEKERAKQLIDKYGKQNALLVIEEIIECICDFAYVGTTWDKQYDDGGYKTGDYEDASKYYYLVKQEIEQSNN